MGCYTDDVLFIHIPKCGGTACKFYMAQHLEGLKWPRTEHHFAELAGRAVTDVKPEDIAAAKESVEESGLPIGHIPLRDIEKYTGRSPDSWERIIGVIRNPYEHQVSQWWFWRERYAMGHHHPHDVNAAQHPRIDTWLETELADFHIWYEQRFHPDEPFIKKPPTAQNGFADWGGYFPYWLAVDGVIPDNVMILRQEELSHQFPLALAPWIDGPPPELGVRNQTAHASWEQYYNSARALEIVHQKFRWTFYQAKAYPMAQYVEDK